ncbi:hypothetical protein ACJMK2_008710 [Sinanodonta woodiana]|uniref:UPAR/Ly6 domain-containing protein n=1 Tax=Sinanodonta woodiana TaxID=1069815 RepID=A0ABD3VQG4_SINWO
MALLVLYLKVALLILHVIGLKSLMYTLSYSVIGLKSLMYSLYYCVIGDDQAYIRDCSDGLTVSFNLTKFCKLLPDNQTTCAYSNNQLVCITLCKTDLCNGPSSASIQMT